MRREKPKEKNIFSVSNAFLFLWWKCECCEEQVRLETVWTFGLPPKNDFGGGYSRVVSRRVMVCKECCPTIELANSFSAAFNEGRNSFPDSSGTPMPKCKPSKLDVDSEVFESGGFVLRCNKAVKIPMDIYNLPDAPAQEKQSNQPELDVAAPQIQPSEPWPRY